MTDFTMSTTIDAPYADAVARVREGLADAGFGVLTEIDIRATLKAKLDVDVPPKVILGACRPQLAHEALGIDPRVAALLPCNVVVSADGDGALVEVMDPNVMPEFTGTEALAGVAADARERLAGMLAGLRA
ncbi:DUF302 domain-containing protein [Tsukamurella sp. PLM1]|uniref:DUF302 domain-containing protein n=1 Tax=Tsukamurella sp. PLM1 TaxID=2929795 RepID=UPI0020516227|nr:DUF302 domain-containing protein [Tsukamurella sp. PLM1]BDH55671.1 ABC transporter ATP-binding protein [Tsukamurella sp. PLM1]